MIKLNIVILSHLNDLQNDIYHYPEVAEIRARFIRSLLLHNDDKNIRVEQEYLDFMWKQAHNGSNNSCSYSAWCVMDACGMWLDNLKNKSYVK